MRTGLPTRGELWWADLDDAGRRPVVVLSRDAAILGRRRSMVAACSTIVRGLPSEVRLEPGDEPMDDGEEEGQTMPSRDERMPLAPTAQPAMPLASMTQAPQLAAPPAPAATPVSAPAAPAADASHAAPPPRTGARWRRRVRGVGGRCGRRRHGCCRRRRRCSQLGRLCHARQRHCRLCGGRQRHALIPTGHRLSLFFAVIHRLVARLEPDLARQAADDGAARRNHAPAAPEDRGVSAEDDDRPAARVVEVCPPQLAPGRQARPHVRRAASRKPSSSPHTSGASACASA